MPKIKSFLSARSLCIGLAVSLISFCLAPRSMKAEPKADRTTPAFIGGTDFVVSSFATHTNWPMGPSIYVTNVVRNQGAVTGPSVYTGLYLSTDEVITTSDVRVSSSFGSVPAGASVTNVLTVRVPSTVPPGWYFLGGIADFTALVQEWNEDNNSLTGPLMRVFLAVDLTMTHVSVPTNVGSGGVFSFTNIVQNVGATTHSDFAVGVYLSPDPTITVADTLMENLTVNGGLQGGTWVTNRTSIDLVNVPPGRYYLGAIADRGHAVAEINETNNTLPGSPIDVLVGVDQVMLGISAQATLTNGLRAFVTNAIANRGFAHSGPMLISHYLSVDNVITTNDHRFGETSIFFSLVAGAAFTNVDQVLVFPLNNIPPAGTYFLGAIIDPFNTVAETDESNNTAVGGQVEVVYGPDLACTFLGVSSSNVVGSSSVTVTSLVQNIGAVAGPFFVDMIFYLSEDPTITSQDVRLEWVTFSGVPMTYALTNTTTVTLSSIVPPGVYYLGALLDPFQRLAEPETNNSFAIPVHLTVEADLTVTGITTYTTNASRSGSLHVVLDVQNPGPTPIDFAISGIFLSSDTEITTNDFRLGLVGSRFGPGETRNYDVTFTVTNSIPAGLYYLGAIVDFPGHVFERVETNNTLVGARVAIRSELDFSPAEVTGPTVAVIGASYRMTNRLANLGLDRSGPTIMALYLSADDNVDTNDWLLGRQLCGAVSGGFTWQGVTNFFISTHLPAGFYHLGGIADPDGFVPETDESNNTFAGGIVEVRDAALIEVTQLTTIGTDVLVRFTTVPGRYYTVEGAVALSGATEWVPVAGAISLPGTGNDVEVRHSEDSTTVQRFYRVRLLP